MRWICKEFRQNFACQGRSCVVFCCTLEICLVFSYYPVSGSISGYPAVFFPGYPTVFPAIRHLVVFPAIQQFFRLSGIRQFLPLSGTPQDIVQNLFFSLYIINRNYNFHPWKIGKKSIQFFTSNLLEGMLNFFWFLFCKFFFTGKKKHK